MNRLKEISFAPAEKAELASGIEVVVQLLEDGDEAVIVNEFLFRGQ